MYHSADFVVILHEVKDLTIEIALFNTPVRADSTFDESGYFFSFHFSTTP